MWSVAGTPGAMDALTTDQASFERVLGRRPQETEGPEAARRAAEDFVSMALVLPILKQVRETNRAAPPFAPGPAEKSFGALLDAEMAGRLVRSTRFGIVDAVAERIGGAARGGTDGQSAGDDENFGAGIGTLIREGPGSMVLKGGGS